MSRSTILIDNDGELFVSNGTAGGTSSVGPIENADEAGLFSGGEVPDFVLYKGKAWFAGRDDSESFGPVGLWSSDGTADGTTELTGIVNANTSGVLEGGSDDLIVAFGDLLFQGDDAKAREGLWVSNGSLSGTHELTGIANAYAGGVFEGVSDPDFTLYGGAVFFAGHDASGNLGLWETTTGTAAGTHEVAVATAGVGGVFHSSQATPGFTVLTNGKMIFSGVGADGFNNLWVMAGAGATPVELTGIKGVTSHASFIGGSGEPADFTAYRGGAVFQGNQFLYSSINMQGVTTYTVRNSLWYTDGSVGGTFQIPVPEAINTSPYGLDPVPGFAVLNGKLLFSANDENEAGSLWVLSSPHATPTELNTIANAPFSLEPANLTTFGDYVYFTGDDKNGEVGLWRTDGTSTGTIEIEVLSSEQLTDFSMSALNLDTPIVSIKQFTGEETSLNGIAGGFDVADAAKTIASNIALLQSDIGHINSIAATGGEVSVSAAAFGADKPALDKIVGGFVVSDTASNVKGRLGGLEADIAHVVAVDLTGKGAHSLTVSAAQDVADAKLIAEIATPYVLDVTVKTGVTTTTGHGDHLTISDVKGTDAITGGGTNETFVFDDGFGQATIKDASADWTGKTSHDVIDFAKGLFADGFTTLLKDATFPNGHATITVGKDVLVLDGFANAAALTKGHNLGDFVFG